MYIRKFGLTMLVCLLLNCTIVTNALGLGISSWTLLYYVDEFKLPTNKAYITNSQEIYGTFSNSIVEDAPLLTSIVIDEDGVSFVLYEYKNNKVRNSHSQAKKYNIIMLDAQRNKSYFTGKIAASSGDRIQINDGYDVEIIKALKNNATLSFYIEEADAPYINYLFSVTNLGFETTLTSLIQSVNDIDYQEAVSLYNSGDYLKALEIFRQLGDYKDSAEWATKYHSMRYNEAEVALNEGFISEAIKIFSEIKGYSDATKRAQELADILSENSYIEAKKYILSEDFESAAKLLESLGNYKDSKQLANYYYGRNAENKREFRKACDYFKAADGYKDASDRAFICRLHLYDDEELHYYDQENNIMIFHDYHSWGKKINLSTKTSHSYSFDGYDSILSEIGLMEVSIGSILGGTKKCGIADLDGNLIIPCEWDQIKYLGNNLFKVKSGDKYGLINISGDVITPCKWDSIGSFNDGLASCEEWPKYGYINEAGKLVIECKYRDVYSFNEGYTTVKISDEKGWAFLDVNGKVLKLKKKLWHAEPFHEDLAIIGESGSTYANKYMNKKGEIVISGTWKDSLSFHEGLAAVKDRFSEEWGFINKSGDFVIDYQYEDVRSFQSGIAPVMKNEKWGFVNKEGTEIIKCSYDDVSLLDNGLIRCQVKKKYGIIDREGNTIIPCIHDHIIYEINNGLLVISDDDNLTVIDANGNIVF